METIISEARSKPWFLNVPGNQFLVDTLKLVLIGLVVGFIAFIVLLVIWPGLFQGYARKSNGDSGWSWMKIKSVIDNQPILNEWTTILLNSLEEQSKILF